MSIQRITEIMDKPILTGTDAERLAYTEMKVNDIWYVKSGTAIVASWIYTGTEWLSLWITT